MSGFISSSTNPVVLPRTEGDGEAFGAYRLHESLGTGGMAQVFKASVPMLGGRLEKIVAIKRILSFFTEDQSFVDLLIDEARLAMRLHHPNIVQTFEVGEVGDVLYLAMEYVDGPSLSSLLRTFREQSKLLPVEHALFIGMELASALGFAHSLCDPDGEHLGVIHRDVSPHNVLISTTGQVKLIDFGVAKARDRIVKTMDGAVRGKIGYFSPERAEGDPFDHRADLFALGICLYEMLTGSHPLGKKGQMESLLALQSWEPPKLSDIRSDLPPELDRILLRILASDPESRYPDGEALRSDLAAVLYTRSPRFSGARLAQFLRRIDDGDFGECLPASLSSVSQPAVPRLPSPPPPDEDAPSSSIAVVAGGEAEAAPDITERPTMMFGDEGPDAPVEERPTIVFDDEKPTLLHDDDDEVFQRVGAREAARLRNPSVAVQEVMRYKQRTRSTTYLAAGLGVLVVVFGIIAMSLYVRANKAENDLNNAAESRGEAPLKPPPTATLRIESSPAGATVLINHQAIGLTTPAKLEDLKAGEPLAIELNREGFDSKSVVITPEAGRDMIYSIELNPSSVRLSVSLTPPGAAVLVTSPGTESEKRFLINNAGEVHIADAGLHVGKAVHIHIERDNATVHSLRFVPQRVQEQLDIDLPPPPTPKKKRRRR